METIVNTSAIIKNKMEAQDNKYLERKRGKKSPKLYDLETDSRLKGIDDSFCGWLDEDDDSFF